MQKSHGFRSCYILKNNDNIIKKAVEEIITASKVHKCPTCESRYIKTDGCKHITCPKCKTESCYTCGFLWISEHLHDKCNMPYNIDSQILSNKLTSLINANKKSIKNKIINEMKKHRL